MTRTKVQFPNREGNTLAAYLEYPEEPPRAFALFAHCFTCSRNLSAVRRISRGLLDKGIGMLSFDFTGLGESGGDFSTAGFAHQTDDLLQAAAYLEEHVGASPALLVGHSLGGTAVLYAAREMQGARGVATIGSPADPEHVTRLFDCEVEEIERTGIATVDIGGRPFTIHKSFVDDLRSHPPDQWLSELKKPVLLFHSPVDATVDVSNAQRIFMALRHPKSFVSLDKADHLLTEKRDARFVAGVIAAWAESFLDQ